MLTTLSSPPRKISSLEVLHPHAQEFRILVVIPTLGERLETLRRTLSSIQDQTGVFVDTVLVAKTKTPELSAIADHYGARIVYRCV